MPVTVGIDTGNDGGIAWVGDNGSGAENMPTRDSIMVNKNRRRGTDGTEVFEMLKLIEPDIIWIEMVIGRGGWSAQSNLSFGRGCGEIDCAIQMLRKWQARNAIPQAEVCYVEAKTWQQAVLGFITSKKEITMDWASQFYPHLDLRKCRTPRGTAISSGMCDALAIAHYGAHG